MRVLAGTVVVLALCLVAVSEHQPMVASAAPSPTPRYQIVINPNARADTFLLDTETGRVWQPTTFTDLPKEPEIWLLQDRADNRQQLNDWIDRHKIKSEENGVAK